VAAGSLIERTRARVAEFRTGDSGSIEKAAGLGFAALVGNVFGLAFTVLLARALGPEDYGSVATLVSAFLIVSIAGSALQITVAREVSLEDQRHDPALRQHVRGWLIAVGSITVVATVVGALLRNPIASLIGVDGDGWAAAIILPTGAFWLLLSILRGVLQGLQDYRLVALSIVGEATLRMLVAVVVLVAGLGVFGGFAASGLSIVFVSAALLLPLRAKLIEHEHSGEDQSGGESPSFSTDWRFSALVSRTWPALVALSLIALLQNSDVIMVKRAATETAAGAYAADAVAAKVIIWIAIGVGFYVVPEAARSGGGKHARSVLARTAGLTFVVGALMVGTYLAFGQQLLEIAFGADYGVESRALPLLGAAMTLLAATYLACQFFLALERHLFLLLLGLGVVVQIAVVSQVASSPLDTAFAMFFVQAGVAAAMFVASGLSTRARG
jgi:O-antigen/teichoic acid export membrane protein